MTEMLDIIVVREIPEGTIKGAFYAERERFVSYKHELEFMQKVYDQLTLNYCPKCHEFIVGITDTVDDFIANVIDLKMPQRYWLN